MKKNILFFSNDRLGDYLIRSNVIHKISKNYNNVEIVASNKNFKLIKSQKFFNKVYNFNLNKKIYEKFRFIVSFFLKKYDSAIVFDGKNISNIVLLFIRAKFKFTFLYKKNSYINYLYLKIISIFYKFLNINYEYLLSRNLIEKDFDENYPVKYKVLKKYYGDIFSETYYIENSNINEYNKIKNEYIIIHLDEKFIDIKGIDENFSNSLTKLKERIKKKIFLTSFKNNYNYYKSLTHKKLHFKNINLNILKISDILIIEDMPLDYLQNLIQNSLINISCHSGLFVHTSIALKKTTIDIIHKSQKKWFNTWIDERNNYLQIYKSNESYTYDIDEILNLIYEKKKFI